MIPFFSFVTTCLTMTSFVISFENIQENRQSESKLLKKLEAFTSRGFLVNKPQENEYFLQNYMMENLRKNTFRALEELTENWKLVSSRSGRQEEEVEKAQLAVVGASLKIADAIVRSLMSVVSTAFGFGRTPINKSPTKNISPAPTSDASKAPKTKIENDNYPTRLMSNYDEIKFKSLVDSLSDKSYSDQLAGVLNLLVRQQGSAQPTQETVKSTVDYILDLYMASNKNTQALFLPKLFEGIKKQP